MLRYFGVLVFVNLFAGLFLNVFAVPSFGNSIETRFSNDVPDEVSAFVNKAITDEIDTFERNFGFVFERDFVLLVSSDTEFLISERIAAHDGNLSRSKIQGYYDSHCKVAGNKIFGLADAYTLSLCWQKHTLTAEEWLARSGKTIQSVLRHELMHAAQRQLSDFYSLSQDQRAFFKPYWLVEGTANLVQFSDQNLYGDLEARLKFLTKRSADIEESLQEFEDRIFPFPKEGYRLSEHAAVILAQKRGVSSIFDYWECLGSAVFWEACFNLEFRTTPTNFYRQFKKIRSDAEAALQWVGR